MILLVVYLRVLLFSVCSARHRDHHLFAVHGAHSLPRIRGLLLFLCFGRFVVSIVVIVMLRAGEAGHPRHPGHDRAALRHDCMLVLFCVCILLF